MKAVFSSSSSFQSLGREASKSLSTCGQILYLSSLFAHTQNERSLRKSTFLLCGVQLCSTSQKYLTTSLKITKRLKIKKKSKNIYAGRRRVRRAREENSRAKRTREKEERKSGYVVQEIGSGFFVVREEEFKEGRRRR